MRLEDLKPGAVVHGLDPTGPATIAVVTAHGSEVVEVFYKTADGRAASELLYHSDEDRLDLSSAGRAWAFDGDGALFRLTAEAQRIRLAHLFDPLLAVHTSDVEPLPHQITAVYEEMLPRQPLRFLLADDPGAGKTIMAGLLIREIIARGDLERCLIVCPGSLAEQWQDELEQRFNLRFAILTNQGLEATRGNWFEQNDLVIARLDKLSRDEELQQKLRSRDADWDLVVCDEAHKFSARRFGSEVRYTKRYQLGRLLSDRTRHFLLMTATPHNGKEEDFQLFMALLDGDRFEGRPRDGVHAADTSDLMRRMVKERLVTFDNKPLFPERIATTVPYRLSDDETRLYGEVTAYVRGEFNRAEALANRKRAGTVGFALTMLQRRLASSPEAIYQSLKRRRQRLQERLREFETLQRGGQHALIVQSLQPPELDEDDFEDLEDAPEEEFRETESQVLDQATAAQSINELKAEINTLGQFESLARKVRDSGQDTKWRELSSVLNDELFRSNDRRSTDEPAAARKLVLFTEHLDRSCPQPRDHRQLPAFVLLQVRPFPHHLRRDLDLRVQMPDALLCLLPHPATVEPHILRQPLRAPPVLAADPRLASPLLPGAPCGIRAGDGEVPEGRVHRRPASEPRWNLYHRLVDQHRHRIQVARVRLEPQPLSLQRQCPAAGERIVKRRQLPRIEQISGPRMTGVPLACPPPTLPDLLSGRLQNPLVRGAFPHHELSENPEQPLPFEFRRHFRQGLPIVSDRGVRSRRRPAVRAATRQFRLRFASLRRVRQELVHVLRRIVDHLPDHRPRRCQGAPRPPQVQRRRMAVPNRLLTRRRHVDCIQRQRHLDQLLVHSVLLGHRHDCSGFRLGVPPRQVKGRASASAASSACPGPELAPSTLASPSTPTRRAERASAVSQTPPDREASAA